MLSHMGTFGTWTHKAVLEKYSLLWDTMCQLPDFAKDQLVGYRLDGRFTIGASSGGSAVSHG